MIIIQADGWTQPRSEQLCEKKSWKQNCWRHFYQFLQIVSCHFGCVLNLWLNCRVTTSSRITLNVKNLLLLYFEVLLALCFHPAIFRLTPFLHPKQTATQEMWQIWNALITQVEVISFISIKLLFFMNCVRFHFVRVVALSLTPSTASVHFIHYRK